MAVTLTRVFDSYAGARDAIVDLQRAGVDARCISVLTRSRSDAQVLNQDTGASDDLEDAAVRRNQLADFVDWLGRVETMAVPGFGAVLGTGDVWLAGKGRGSVTGALVGVGVPVDEAAQLEQAVNAGRILVVVHVNYDPTAASRVLPANG
jgi:hypothetical protein